MKEPIVLVVQHVDAEGPGRIASALERAGLSLHVVHSGRGDAVPDAIDEFAALVVMGGPMGVYEQEAFPFLFVERRLLIQAIARRTPTLGICLGAQLLASALGARVSPSGGFEIGYRPVRTTDEARADRLFASVPTTFTPLHWHGDVFELPERAVSLAASESTVHQAFAFEDFAWGLLFHLEATPDHVDAMARTFPEDLRRGGLDASMLGAESRTRDAELAAIASTVFDAFARRIHAHLAEAGS